MTTPQLSKLSFYRRGRTTLYASRYDQRFSHCCYVPESYDEEAQDVYPLTVLIHHTGRTASLLRDEFVDFAEANQCIVLAPLFPSGIIHPNDLNNYKHVLYHGIRYDLVLLDMIEEISAIYRIHADKFLMHGFSGGGQFVHRFLYLHPQRLMGVSVGAPGTVTLPDDDKDWWIGTRGMEERFGIKLDVDALRSVPVQLVIGDKDVETWEVTVRTTSNFWMEGINDTGETRIDRLRALQMGLESLGVKTRFDFVPGVAHQGVLIQEPVKAFFAEALSQYRKRVELIAARPPA